MGSQNTNPRVHSNHTQSSMEATKRPHHTDITSNLPEQILCHILSFLPTKTAVACSILSKKWQLLWSLLPNLDFDTSLNPGGRGEYVSASFVHFVYRVLLLRGEWGVKIFRIKAKCSLTGNEIHVESWIYAAVTRGVEELDINISGFKLTQSLLFSFEKLQVLKLNRLYFTVENYCLFSSLKVLHLVGVTDESSSFVKSFHQNLLSSCPVLEELIINVEIGDDLRICVPTLTRLVVEIMNERDLGPFRLMRPDFLSNFLLVLDTPALKYLSLRLHASQHTLVAQNLCSLTQVQVDSLAHGLDFGDESFKPNVLYLLSKLSSVKFLNLSCNTMEVLAHSSFNKLPVFYNLLRVELNIRSKDWVVLQHLLHKFQNLEDLVVIKEELSPYHREACWKEPLQVPNCLSFHLMTFCYQGFEGLESETEFFIYVLKNSMVLKNATISTSSSLKSITHLLQECLSVVPRGSKACQLLLN